MPMHPSDVFRILGIFGIPAIGVGSGQLVEEVYPTVDRVMNKSGYKWRPIKAGAQIGWNSRRSDAMNGSKCFEAIFGEIAGILKNKGIFYHNIDRFTKTDSIKHTKVQPTNSSDSNTMGCAFIRMSNIFNKEKRMQEFQFISELSFRNENVGIVLQASGVYDTLMRNRSGTIASPNTSYIMFFLEKGNTDIWSIKLGYSGTDRKVKRVPNANSVFFSPYISISGNKGEIPEETGVISKDYTGIGKEDSKGNEFFQDIKYQKDDKTAGEILGIKDTNFSESYEGYKKITITFDGSDGVIISKDGNIMKPTDVSESISHWYKPFKSKRGKWIELEGYCKKYYYARGYQNDRDKLDDMRRFCYSSSYF